MGSIQGQVGWAFEHSNLVEEIHPCLLQSEVGLADF